MTYAWRKVSSQVLGLTWRCMLIRIFGRRSVTAAKVGHEARDVGLG